MINCFCVTADKKEDTGSVPEPVEPAELKRRQLELEKFRAEIDKLGSVNAVEKDDASTVKGELDTVQPSPASDESHVGENKITKVSVNGSEYSDKPKEDLYSFQKSFVILNPKRPKVLDDIETQENLAASAATINPIANISLVTKCEEFLQSVKKNVIETGPTQAVTKKTKNMTEEPSKPPTNVSAFIDIDIGEY